MKIIGGIVILALVVGGFFYYRSTQTTKSDESTVEPTNSESEEPTPTEAEVKPDAYKIEILNGSGIEGEAGRAEELLKAAEFDIIGTDNADNYDYEETVIQAGDDVNEAWLDDLKSELSKKYKVQSSVDKLDTETDAQVVVIVGSFDQDGESMVKEEEATPTPEEEEETTPTPTGEEETTETPSPSPSLTPTPT